MSRARLDLPHTADSRLTEYHELIELGYDHDHASRRVGVTPKSMADRLHKARTRKGAE